MADTGNSQPKKRTFDAAFKRKVVEYAENHSNRKAGRKFSVDEESLRYWKKQKADLTALPNRKELPGAGRKPKLPYREKELASWFLEQRSLNLRITRSAIQHKAIQLAKGDEDFAASRGWLESFLKRHDFSLKRRITISHKFPHRTTPPKLFHS